MRKQPRKKVRIPSTDKLEAVRPELARFWSAEDNRRIFNLDFEDVIMNCSWQFRWRCPECGFSWNAKLKNVVNADEADLCPRCRSKRAEQTRASAVQRTKEKQEKKRGRKELEEVSWPVVGVDLKTGEMREHATARDAGREIGAYPSNVVYTCNHERKSAKGFAWFWADDEAERAAARRLSDRIRADLPDSSEEAQAGARGGSEGRRRFFAAELDVAPVKRGAECWPVVVETAFDWLSTKEEAARRAERRTTVADVADWDAAFAWSSDLAMTARSASALRDRSVPALEAWAKQATVEVDRGRTVPSLLEGDIVDLRDVDAATPCAAAVTRQFAFGMEAERGGIALRTISDAPENGLPEAWLMELAERKGGAVWTTTVDTSRSDGGCHVSIAVDVDLPDGETPGRNAPRIVREIVARKELACTVDGIALSTVPRKVDLQSRESYDAFVADVKDRSRAIPLVVVGSNELDKYACDAADLARRLAGVATVATLSWRDTGLRHRLDASFAGADRELRPSEGMVSVYPGACRQSGDAPAKRTFEPSGSRNIARTVVETALEMLASKPPAAAAGPKEATPVEDAAAPADGPGRELPDEVPSTPSPSDDVAAAPARTAQREAADAEKAVSALASAVEQVKALLGVEAPAATAADDREALEELLHESQDALEAQKRRAADLAGKNAALEARVAALEEEAARLRGLESGAVAIEEIPETMDQVVDLAERTFTGRLAFVRKARASAKDDGTGGYREAWRILRALDRVLWPILFEEREGAGRRAADEFKEQTGFELAWNESELTEASTRAKTERTILWKNKKTVMKAHVKGQSGCKSNRLRVYFHVDQESKLIVVGWCGNHLTTEGTKRRSVQ